MADTASPLCWELVTVLSLWILWLSDKGWLSPCPALPPPACATSCEPPCPAQPADSQPCSLAPPRPAWGAVVAAVWSLTVSTSPAVSWLRIKPVSTRRERCVPCRLVFSVVLRGRGGFKVSPLGCSAGKGAVQGVGQGPLLSWAAWEVPAGCLVLNAVSPALTTRGQDQKPSLEAGCGLQAWAWRQGQGRAGLALEVGTLGRWHAAFPASLQHELRAWGPQGRAVPLASQCKETSLEEASPPHWTDARHSMAGCPLPARPCRPVQCPPAAQQTLGPATKLPHTGPSGVAKSVYFKIKRVTGATSPGCHNPVSASFLCHRLNK
nr:uncharacterized protein LOC127488585 [Oryctolagus cuniculus]